MNSIDHSLASCAGYVGAIFVVAAFWVRRDRDLNVLLFIGLGLVGVQMASIGAIPAAASYAVASARSGGFLLRPGSRAVACASILAAWILAVATWNGLPGALILLASTAVTLAMTCLSRGRLRLALAATGIVFCIHHVVVGSMPALVMELVCLVGNVTGAWRGLFPRKMAA